MSELLEQATKEIRERFGAEEIRFRDEITLMLKPEHLLEASQILRTNYSFDVLLDETAVDYWPEQTPRFHVVYQLCSSSANVLLRLRVPLDGNAPHIETIEKLYPMANWKEREIWDLMGITFDGHSDPRRIMMPADWEGHPLRKDYPLGYEEVQFSFNKEEVDSHKPYPKN